MQSTHANHPRKSSSLPAHGVDTIVFDSGLVRIGAFRCEPDDPMFHDSGPAENYCFVFPRTAVEIQHEHERAFVANPNVVTFYNRGQPYRRNTISPDGDRCDWYGVDVDVVRDVIRTFDPGVDDRPEQPFAMTRAFSDARTYLFQRQVFRRACADSAPAPLALEEAAVFLLECVARAAYTGPDPERDEPVTRKQRDAVHQSEWLLSREWNDNLRLHDLARAAGLSVFHLCRTFRRVTGMTLHQYRLNLRVRHALQDVCESRAPLVRIAFESGFSSHSHFTSLFHDQFGEAPSTVRGRR
jgi:AraC family transcriptional regulator